MKKQLEIKKFNTIDRCIEKDLLYKRFDNLTHLKKYLKTQYKINSTYQHPEPITDFEITGVINQNWGYVDMYYTRGSKGILITEITTSNE